MNTIQTALLDTAIKNNQKWREEMHANELEKQNIRLKEMIQLHEQYPQSISNTILLNQESSGINDTFFFETPKNPNGSDNCWDCFKSVGPIPCVNLELKIKELPKFELFSPIEDSRLIQWMKKGNELFSRTRVDSEASLDSGIASPSPRPETPVDFRRTEFRKKVVEEWQRKIREVI